MRKPLPHEISTEELLASLEGQDLVNEKATFSFDNPILSFVQAFKLSQGKELVSDRVLHTLFKIWSGNTAIDQRNFNYKLGVYLPSIMKNRRYYTVNSKILEVAKKLQILQKSYKKDKVNSIHWNSHFEKFLEHTGLEAGTVFVEIDILFYIYNRWCDETRKTAKLGHDNFLGICKLNFQEKRLSNSKIAWLGVNDKIKTLITREEVNRWRQGRRNNGKKKNSKEKTQEVDQWEPYEGYKKKTLYPKK